MNARAYLQNLLHERIGVGQLELRHKRPVRVGQEGDVGRGRQFSVRMVGENFIQSRRPEQFVPRAGRLEREVR